jgi:transcriptional regulator with XRE-family HTH domain
MDGLEKDTAFLKALAKHEGLTPAALAREAGVAVTTINRPYSGTSQHRLSQPTLDKLRNRFPDFPGWPEYLGQTDASLSDRRLEFRHEGGNDDTVQLDQIDLRYGLGGTYADGHVEVERRPFSREWLRSITSTPPRHLFWAIGDGDSMEPTIRSGEVILIDRSQDTPRLDDGIWAVVHGEIGMIKRLRHLPGGSVELHSDNQYVRPQTAVDGELHIVGRVIAVVRRL